MSTKYVGPGCLNLNCDGQKILATEIRKDKSLKEIAEILGVDIEIVKRTAEEVIRFAMDRGMSSIAVEKLKKSVEEMENE